MLPESALSGPSLRSVAPTLRQGRLEERVAQAIAAAAPRSTIRDAVDQLVMHLRWLQIPAERGVAIVIDVASRAIAARPATSRDLDTSLDYTTLVAAWARGRYARAD
jgi:hypothetical protein